MTAPHSGGSFGHNEETEEHLIDPIDGEDAEGNPTVESSGESSSSSGEDEEGNPVAKSNDGSSPSDDEETEEHLIDPIDAAKIKTKIHDTIQQLEEADRPTIKDLLGTLFSKFEDALAMSDILSNAENALLSEDNNTVNRFLSSNTAVSILEFVGAQIDDGRVLYKGEATPILIAVASMIDYIIEFKRKGGDLNNLFHSM